MFAADQPKEAEEHFENVKINVASGIISGIVGICLIALFYVPALPLAAVITAATIASLTIIPPVIIGLGVKLINFGSWMYRRIDKWWREKQGLQGPGNRYDITTGKGRTSESLEENIIYVDAIMKDDNGHQ